MARFNEQIEPIYVLLRETEDVNLSHDLLEPEPAEIPALKQRSVSGKPHRNAPLIPLSQHHISSLESHPGAVSLTTDGSSPLLTAITVSVILAQPHNCLCFVSTLHSLNVLCRHINSKFEDPCLKDIY